MLHLEAGSSRSRKNCQYSTEGQIRHENLAPVLIIVRRIKSTPDPDTFEKYHDTPPWVGKAGEFQVTMLPPLGVAIADPQPFKQQRLG